MSYSVDLEPTPTPTSEAEERDAVPPAAEGGEGPREDTPTAPAAEASGTDPKGQQDAPKDSKGPDDEDNPSWLAGLVTPSPATEAEGPPPPPTEGTPVPGLVPPGPPKDPSPPEVPAAAVAGSSEKTGSQETPVAATTPAAAPAAKGADP